jgi:hypothetical protein
VIVTVHGAGETGSRVPDQPEPDQLACR